MAAGSEVYILSGLGADERVFAEIDFGPFAPVFIPWEKLESTSQTFESYIEQLSRQVRVPDPILIGISLGGIVAQEMSTLFNDCPVLIIASAKTRLELPPPMRFSGLIGLHKLIPIKRVLKTKWLNYWLFGTKTEKEKKILDEILADSDPIFTKWAIGKVANWKRRTQVPANVLHIHGDQDRIFPMGNLNPDYLIPGGTHFMTVSQPEKLSRTIQDALNRLADT